MRNTKDSLYCCFKLIKMKCFDYYMDHWQLIPDGELIITRSSKLLPVVQNTVPAMLKIAEEPEEKSGANLMVWWNGHGAAGVLAHENNALLLERATGGRSLSNMAKNGDDTGASKIICKAVHALHRQTLSKLPELVPLVQWFAELDTGAAKYGGLLSLCAETAHALLSLQEDVVILHGDIHHHNILDFGERGWLAIDPKGLIGERGFDYANMFCNPDHKTATMPGRLAKQAAVVSSAAGLNRKRLLQWLLAWAGLSALWSFNDGIEKEMDLKIAEIAAAELRK
jgi:streptomycin 6-kinase